MAGPNLTGVVIQGDDSNYLEPVFLVKVSRHNMVHDIICLSKIILSSLP